MSFRRRITIVSSAAVAVAVVLASLLTYVLTSDQLHRQVDTQLRNRGREAGRLVRFFNGTGRASAAGCTHRFAASMVPRQRGLPQRHSNCFFTLAVCRPSRTRP